MATVNLLYQDSYRINDAIQIRIPTVGEILKNEDEYYNIVGLLTAMPIDMMVQLDDAGIDFTTINEFDLFMMTFQSLKRTDTSMVFVDLDLTGFQPVINVQNNQLMLGDTKTGVKIDRAIQGQISFILRKIHGLEKNLHVPANKEAKEYMLERARVKAKRRKRMTESNLERDIVALVNTSEFPYNYQSVQDLTIYQFNLSLRQVIKKIDYDNRMHGVYSGTVNAKELRQEDLTWLTRT